MNIYFRSSRRWAVPAPLLAAGAFVLAAGILPRPASADAPTAAAISTLYSFGVTDTIYGNLLGYSPHSIVSAPNNTLYLLTQGGGPLVGNGALLEFRGECRRFRHLAA